MEKDNFAEIEVQIVLWFQVNIPFAETSCGDRCSCNWGSIGFEPGTKSHNFCSHEEVVIVVIRISTKSSFFRHVLNHGTELSFAD